MSGDQRRGGMIEVKVGSVMQECKGEFTFNLGKPIKKAIEGSNRITGYGEKPQVAFIEGAITDSPGLNQGDLQSIKDETITLTLGVGKTVILRHAFYAHEGTGKTDEGEIPVRFESAFPAEEI